MRIRVDFPFTDGVFPADLGAFISRTVVEGRAAVLYVQHTHDNAWVLTDAVGDPNEEDALVVACIWHAIDQDPTLESMSELPCGVEAVRDFSGARWRSRSYEEEDSE